MHLTDEEIRKDRFITTTNKDYFEKKKERVKIMFPKQEFRDPIAATYEHFLEIDRDKDKLKVPKEDADQYLLKLKKKDPKKIERYFQSPLNHFYIKEEELLGKNTIYRIDYCNIAQKVKRQLLKTVEEHKEIPDGLVPQETTLKSAYRNPVHLNKHCMDPKLVIIPPNNLGLTDKMRKILKVKTGTTSYEDDYSTFGEMIIKNKVYGPMNRPKVEDHYP